MVSTARDPKRRFRFILGFCSAAAAVAIVIMIPGCGLDERRAGRLHEQAARQVDGHDLEGAVATLQRVIDRYPGTRAAAAARKEIVLYRGLIDAARRFPTRRASDVVIVVARAIRALPRRSKRVPGEPSRSGSDLSDRSRERSMGPAADLRIHIAEHLRAQMPRRR